MESCAGIAPLMESHWLSALRGAAFTRGAMLLWVVVLVVLYDPAVTVAGQEPGRGDHGTAALGQSTRNPPGTWEAVPLTWRSGTMQWRGQFGRRESVWCPPGGRIEPVFGTDFYTDDSSLCTAAIHAGLLASPEEGGMVSDEVRPDPSQYLGTVRHGITSENWFDHWPSSFIFLRRPFRDTVAPAISADARTSAEPWPDSAGRTLTFLCPPRVEVLSVFGTDLYSDDSPICSAALHAGRLSHRAGGLVTIVLRPGQTSYVGHARNDIQSMTAESRPQSYAFVDTPPNTPLPHSLNTTYRLPDGSESTMVPVE